MCRLSTRFFVGKTGERDQAGSRLTQSDVGTGLCTGMSILWRCYREFKLKCCGVGVHPPLQLSHQVVQFKATALFDMSVASIFVVNNHLDKREYKHPVPRIGTGELCTLTGQCFGSCNLSADKYNGKYRCVPQHVLALIYVKLQLLSLIL